MNRVNRVLLGCMLLILIISGCASKGVDNKQAIVNDTMRRDELVLAIGSEPEEGFDPTSGWGRYGSPLFQSTLLKRDNELNIMHDLATNYEVSPDGKKWTVKLREDAHFSDGQPLTAADVVFTYRTAASSGSVLDLSNMEDVAANGDYSVIFTLKEPDSTFVSILVGTGIVPEHAYNSSYSAHPVGSGPYKLVQWDRGQQLIVELNEDYYGDKPFFKKLTFLFLSEDAAFAAARAGQVDAAYIGYSYANQQVEGMQLHNVATVDNRGIMFPYAPSGEVTEEGYPIGNDVTSDLAIRQAVNTAVNRQQLVNGILHGYGSPAYSVSDHMPWWNPDTVTADGDPAEAQRILAAAGWVDTDGDGIAEKNGLKAEFTLFYPSGDTTRQALALAAADMVKQAGIQIHVEGKGWNEIEQLMHANAVLMGFGSHTPKEIYHVYSSKFQGVEYYNAGYYSNPVSDQWMEKALQALTEEEALPYWQKAQWDGQTGFSGLGDTAWAWLVNIDHLYLVNDQLDIGTQPIQPHTHGFLITDNIEEWRWKK